MIILFVFLGILLSVSFGQTMTNTLFAKKNSKDLTMEFNIRINGENYFETGQVVTQFNSFESFEFQREFDDVIEVIFTEDTSASPGVYNIETGDQTIIFDSQTINFFPVNQCLTDNCSFMITSTGQFPDFITVSVFVNGIQSSIQNYNGSTDPTLINVGRDDFINVQLSSGTTSSFSMNLVTTEGGLVTTIPWYNQNLATQMLIPSVYFVLPLEGVTIYPETSLPVELVSYPVDNEFSLKLQCFNVTSTSSVDSNTEGETFFIIPTLTTNPCNLTVEFSEQSSEYFGLNEVSLTISSTPHPTSIEFDENIINSSYSAGSSVPIKLDSGDNSGNFMVQLACENLDPATSVIASNTNDPQSFLIPSDLYGNNCIFSIIYPPLQTTNTPSIIVIRQNTKLKFINAPNRLINTQPSFVVRIDSVGVQVPESQSVDLQLNCQTVGQVKSWNPVALNSTVTLNLNEPGISGGPYSCTFSTVTDENYAQISSTLTLLTQITPAEFSAFVQANGLTPAAGWIV